MAKQSRLSLPSYLYHVIPRGNNRQPIFLRRVETNGAVATSYAPFTCWSH
jgi:REP element-mobilizing transposase RayT